MKYTNRKGCAECAVKLIVIIIAIVGVTVFFGFITSEDTEKKAGAKEVTASQLNITDGVAKPLEDIAANIHNISLPLPLTNMEVKLTDLKQQLLKYHKKIQENETNIIWSLDIKEKALDDREKTLDIKQ